MSVTADDSDTALDEGTQILDALEDVFEAYRHQHLQTELDRIAATMEETLLQVTIAERLFDTTPRIDSEAQSRVDDARTLLDEGAVSELADEIGDIRQAVDQANRAVENEIQELRVHKLETVTAMRRINEEIDVMDHAKLLGLENLYDHWDWKEQVQYEKHDTFEERREAAEAFGSDMADVFTDAKDAIGEEFDDETVQTLLTNLLNNRGIAVTDIGREEMQALVDSDIGDYIELTLGGSETDPPADE